MNTVVTTLHEAGGREGRHGRRVTSRVHAWSLPSALALWRVAVSWALGTTALAVLGIWTGMS